MYSKCLYLFAFLGLVGLVLTQEPRWSVLPNNGAIPPQMDGANALLIDPERIVMFNGFQDNCAEATNFFYDNSQIYLYETGINRGTYIPATGSIPRQHHSSTSNIDGPRVFAPAWVSSPGKAVTAGGTYYTFFFSNFTFFNYTPLYELDARDIDGFSWTSFEPLGDVPSARAEAAVIQDPLHPDNVYVVGGIGFAPGSDSDGDLETHMDVYLYQNSLRTFTLIGQDNPFGNSTATMPESRYHPLYYIYHYGPEWDEVEIQVHQGDHRTILTENGGGNDDALYDSWAFDVKTRSWRQLFPDPQLTFPVRHEALFQFRTRGHHTGTSHDLHCWQGGDGLQGPNSPTTIDCIFDIDPIPIGLWCNDPTDNNGNGGWNVIPSTGDQRTEKYITTSTVVAGDDVFIFGGTYGITLNATFNEQAFFQNTRKLALNDLTN